MNRNKLNLIVINIPDQGTEEEDMQAILRMIREEFRLETKITNTPRLGKPLEGNARPLKIEYESLGRQEVGTG